MARKSDFATGPSCPADPLPGSAPHGPLIGREHAPPGRSFYCPHTDHDGRPKTHPLGEARPSSPYYGVDDVT